MAVAYTQEKWAQLKALVFGGVASVISAVMPLLNLFGGGIQEAAAGWLADISQSAATASGDAAAAAERVQAATAGIKSAFDGVKNKLTQGVQALKSSAGKLNTTFTGLSGVGMAVAPAGGSGTSEWEKLERKAEQVSKAIEDQWVQTTKTELEQLERWRIQQLAALEETRAANENYQRDLERLESTYSIRRLKIIGDEQKKKNSIWDQASDAARALQTKLGAIGLSGVDKQKFDLESDAAAQVDSLRKKYRDWAMDYSLATKAQQEEFRAAWTANGIQFQMTEEGMVDFSRQIAAEQVVIEQEKNQKLMDLHYARVKFQEDLDKAREDGDIQRFQELLTKEGAMQERELSGRQQMMDSYYKIWQEAHRTSMSYMAELTDGLYSGFSTFFSDVLSGTKSIGDAFGDLAQSVLKMINDMIAKWLAARLMMGLFGSSLGNFGGNGMFPAFASGGDYAGGYALVGEKGPELIHFNRGGHVYNAQDTKRLIESGDTYHQISVPVSVTGEASPRLAGRLRSEITEMVQRIIYEEARA